MCLVVTKIRTKIIERNLEERERERERERVVLIKRAYGQKSAGRRILCFRSHILTKNRFRKIPGEEKRLIHCILRHREAVR